ncbi:hypothetical protein GobsT_13720 [Gemmata obscuriglobus]|uniref:Uncharacterized protein n=1 Tax=Gemmata obscuriglobus TaxID=114 RepID=A0A2Z3H9G5_9BACT|nr:hypothetical protein [Gemmata obscuriglobus]AWM40187.1 hypothetical protein C1280_26410 [Gemmata obscuriglobus]QEG26629.1 hypothetical protein GobsT_13720 [Gemmata obscuriglobus]VTS02176.1 unnamed protein product [Gemmata obscuriglobus UQM 2246]
MSLSSRFVRLAAGAVAALAWAGAPATAADVPPPPVVSAAPVAVGDPGCATCEHGAATGSCSTCKHHVLLKKNKTPYQVNLCPGACFGYFQTQWRKWDDACPYPYLGHGVGDAPRPASPVINVPRPGSGELNQPRPLPGTDSKPEGKSGLPPIPPVPGGKLMP